jgi:hypothetical protein
MCICKHFDLDFSMSCSKLAFACSQQGISHASSLALALAQELEWLGHQDGIQNQQERVILRVRGSTTMCTENRARVRERNPRPEATHVRAARMLGLANTGPNDRNATVGSKGVRSAKKLVRGLKFAFARLHTVFWLCTFPECHLIFDQHQEIAYAAPGQRTQPGLGGSQPIRHEGLIYLASGHFFNSPCAADL